jgi:GNAT superfamily N-acetyltransferase
MAVHSARCRNCGRENQVLTARWPPHDPGMDLRIATIAERPAMKSQFVNKETEPWPAFMNEDPIALLYFSDVRIAHPEYGLIAYDADTPDQAVARAFCVPFAWDGDPALGELPVDGWDGVIWRSARDRQIGRKPNLVSALEITVPADLQGTGLSGKMLAAMRDNAARLGFEHPIAPVRPNRKHLVPGRPHRRVRGAGPRGRPAPGSMAARSHPGRRPDRRHLQARDGHPRHAGRVAFLDRPAVRVGAGRGARRARARPVQRRA